MRRRISRSGTGLCGDIAAENALILLSGRPIGLNIRARSTLQRSRGGVWGHHRLLVEQLAGVSSQCQLSFQRSDALAGGGQFVGLHTGHALHNAGIDESWRFHRNSVA